MNREVYFFYPVKKTFKTISSKALTKIKVSFQKISAIGLSEDFSYVDRLRISIINEVALFIALMLVVAVAESNINNEENAMYLVSIIFVPLFSIYLHHKKKYNLAKFNLSFILPLLALFCWMFFGNGTGLGYTFPAFLIGSFLLCKIDWTVVVNLIYLTVLFSTGIYFTLNFESPYSGDIGWLDMFLNCGLSVFCMCWVLIRFVDGIRSQEEALNNKNRELEATNLELVKVNTENTFKTELLGMVAHDLRGPAMDYKDLTKKLNYLLQKEDYQRITKLGNYFERSGEKLFSSLDSLLNWVISQQESFVLNKEELDIQKLLEEVINDLNYLSERKTIKIKQPELDLDGLIFTDRNVLKIIVKNILANAIKYTPDHSSVELSYQSEDENLILMVKDSGEGIDYTIISNLTKNGISHKQIAANSHGLGLQTCFYFAKFLGVKLDFKTQNETGTTVKIKIPTRRKINLLRSKTKYEPIS